MAIDLSKLKMLTSRQGIIKISSNAEWYDLMASCLELGIRWSDGEDAPYPRDIRHQMDILCSGKDLFIHFSECYSFGPIVMTYSEHSFPDVEYSDLIPPPFVYEPVLSDDVAKDLLTIIG